MIDTEDDISLLDRLRDAPPGTVPEDDSGEPDPEDRELAAELLVAAASTVIGPQPAGKLAVVLDILERMPPWSRTDSWADVASAVELELGRRVALMNEV